MNKNIFLIFSITTICTCSTSYGCSISEIVHMAERGAGRKAIEKKCDEVDDGPRCSLRQVISYALADKDTSTIKNKCGLCESPVCSTSAGECKLNYEFRRNAKDGGGCKCWYPQYGSYGWVEGTISCELD